MAIDRSAATPSYWERLVTDPILIYPLVTFRILFGSLLLFSTTRFLVLGWIEPHYVEPTFHFRYYGFDWLPILGGPWLYLIHGLLLLGALGFTLGYRYRWSALLVFTSFTYLELIDLSFYLNHYYFVSLVCFLALFVPANRALSLDVRWGRRTYANHVPAWTINAFKLLIAIVYCYAGLAKINADWLLYALPLKIWLPAKDGLPLLGPLFAWDWTPYLFSWAGMLFDTTIVFFLLYRPTRILAYLAVVVFHLLTGLLFQIGVFPLVMIGVVTIFFSPPWHRQLLRRLARWFDPWHLARLDQVAVIPYRLPISRRRPLLSLLMFFFVFQLLFPWRYLAYPGNLFWTEEGYRFSWRVMLMEKSATATFYLREAASEREKIVINRTFLSPHQEKQMAMQPDMVLQFAHHLARHYGTEARPIESVRAEVYVTLNSRPSRLLIDPQFNLLEAREGWRPKSWILPFNPPASQSAR
ncbi:MAG: HTTM domain-containing protein [Bacteroidota bacterium]